MSKQKNRFYVIWEGAERGVFESWEECRVRIDGYKGAKYKGFPSIQEAKVAFTSNSFDYFNNKKPSLEFQQSIIRTGGPIAESISVDAACSGNPGVLEYRGVWTNTQKEIFHRGPFPEGTTNIGEFLAIVTGLAWLKQNNLSIPLYSDSRNGILWVKKKQMNTRLIRTPKNDELFRTVDKAMEWLNNNSWNNPVLKWETAHWGEIPADFGRK